MPAWVFKFISKPIARWVTYILTPIITFFVAKIAIVAPDAASTIDVSGVVITFTAVVIGAIQTLTAKDAKEKGKKVQIVLNEQLPEEDKLKVDGDLGPVSQRTARKVLAARSMPNGKTH